MSTYSSDSLVLKTTGAANTLPDPIGLNGRTHDLTNGFTATTTWSSTGATPFTEDGVNVATLTVTRGVTKRVQSDGARWVVMPPGGVHARREFAGTAVTDGSGNAVFTFTPAFAATPVGVAQVQAAAGQNPLDYRITAISASSMTVQVRQSPTLVVLSLSVLGVSAPIAGVTVHAHATAAGQGV